MTPADVSVLPVYREHPAAEPNEIDQGCDAAATSSDSEVDHRKAPCDEDVAAALADQSRPSEMSGRPPPLSVVCGVMPSGTALHDFHAPPVKIHVRNAEALYWRGFGIQVSEVFGSTAEDDPERALESSWGVSSQSAAAAADRQHVFFKALDKYQASASDGAPSVVSQSSLNLASKTTETSLAHDPYSFLAHDPYNAAVAASVRKMPTTYSKTRTVVMEAAFFLLREGLLHIPDVDCVNVKQARAFLWNAAWLQEFMNKKWHDEDVFAAAASCKALPPMFADFCLAIVGPGGTGKTAVLKVTEALTVFFAGTETVKKLAPSNAAARLLGGDTIHALCKLPFGSVKLSSKKGRLTKAKLSLHRKAWSTTIAAYLDEVSMIAADQFLQCDVRMRQGKENPHQMFGGLAVNVCGDFLQLPPVDKDGSKRSLALPLDDDGHALPVEDEDDRAEDSAKTTHAEGRQGYNLWRSIRKVVCLTVNVRAPDALGRLQEEMRAGIISDAMWDLYMSRVLKPSDPRLTQGVFADNKVLFVVHRHKIRVMRSLEQAKELSRQLRTPLYIVQAHDVAVRHEDEVKLTDSVRADLLRRVNPEQTKGLPSFLPLHRGMRLILSSKDCVRLGVMKGCPVVLRDIVFAEDEVLPYEHVAGQTHSLQYMPTSLLLQAENVVWTLSADELPGDLPKTIDRRGLFQLRPSYDYLRVAIDSNYISVRRTSFLVSPADTVTVYAAQGGTYDAVVADMQRPPNLDLARHWLACYVMISRARSLQGFLVLRPATRKELSSKPPQYLLDELQRLRLLEAESHQQLLEYMESLPMELPPAICEVLARDADAKQDLHVRNARSDLGAIQRSQQHGSEAMLPKRRLYSKTSPESLAASASKRKMEAEQPPPTDGTGTTEDADMLGTAASVAAAGLGILGLSMGASTVQNGEEKSSSSCAPLVAVQSRAEIKKCSKECHVCQVAQERGCASCRRTCHANCDSDLCDFQPCAFCSSLHLITHENSDLCIEAQRETLGVMRADAWDAGQRRPIAIPCVLGTITCAVPVCTEKVAQVAVNSVTRTMQICDVLISNVCAERFHGLRTTRSLWTHKLAQEAESLISRRSSGTSMGSLLAALVRSLLTASPILSAGAIRDEPPTGSTTIV